MPFLRDPAHAHGPEPAPNPCRCPHRHSRSPPGRAGGTLGQRVALPARPPRGPALRRRRRPGRAHLRDRVDRRLHGARLDDRRAGRRGDRARDRPGDRRRRRRHRRRAHPRGRAGTMIRASRALSAAHAAYHFGREYRPGDYFASDGGRAAGTWQGRGAERLGLQGVVAAEDFKALLAGRSPRDGRRLVAPQHGSGKRRAAWELQISPHKSVSLIALVAGDGRVIAAHLAAARRACEVVEEHARTRLGAAGTVIATHNLVVARFDHDASRALDPQLHAHHVILNLTERSPGEWRTLDPLGLLSAMAAGTAVYQAELARGLQALGYEVQADSLGQVTVAGISAHVVGAFSKRREQIVTEVARRGGSTREDFHRALLATRPAKRHDVDPDALRAAWRSEAEGLGVDFDALRRGADERRAAGLTRPPGDPLAQARASVAWAVDRLSERRAWFRGLDVENLALRHATARGPGLDEIRSALAAHSGLMAGPEGRLT